MRGQSLPVEEFIAALPVRKLWGRPEECRALATGIETCGQQQLDAAELGRQFGSFGLELYQLCRGIDERPVVPNRIRKSLSCEHTFAKDLSRLADCELELERLHAELLNELRTTAPERAIAKLVVKLKFSDFRRTSAEQAGHQPDLAVYRALLREAWGRSGEAVRLLGIGLRFAEAHAGPSNSNQPGVTAVFTVWVRPEGAHAKARLSVSRIQRSV